VLAAQPAAAVLTNRLIVCRLMTKVTDTVAIIDSQLSTNSENSCSQLTQPAAAADRVAAAREGLLSPLPTPPAVPVAADCQQPLLPPADRVAAARERLLPSRPSASHQTFADSQKLRHELLHSLDRLESRLVSSSQHIFEDSEVPQSGLDAAAARAGAIEALQALLDDPQTPPAQATSSDRTVTPHTRNARTSESVSVAESVSIAAGI
jgi:hypothetical protein